MKEEINLLPPEIAKSRLQGIYWYRGGSLLRFVLMLMMVLVVVLLGLQVLFSDYGRYLLSQQAEYVKASDDFIDEVESVNDELMAVQRWREQHRLWTPFLPDVFDVIPSGILLTELEVDGRSKELSIRGVFDSRESLLRFQRELEDIDWIDQVESPLSNFATGDQIRFVLIITADNL